MRIRIACLVAALAMACTGAAHASPIEYIFTGVGTGTLDSSAFTDATFTVSLIGDTSTVAQTSTSPNFFQNHAVVTTFASGALSANITGAYIQVISGEPSGSESLSAVSFDQAQPSPIFSVGTAVFGSAFNAYDLQSLFAQTAGTPSSAPDPFNTDKGDLSFTSISSLSFEAVPAPVPLPGAAWLLLSGIAGLGVLLRRRQREGDFNSALPRLALA